MNTIEDLFIFCAKEGITLEICYDTTVQAHVIKLSKNIRDDVYFIKRYISPDNHSAFTYIEDMLYDALSNFDDIEKMEEETDD